MIHTYRVVLVHGSERDKPRGCTFCCYEGPDLVSHIPLLSSRALNELSHMIKVVYNVVTRFLCRSAQVELPSLRQLVHDFFHCTSVCIQNPARDVLEASFFHSNKAARSTAFDLLVIQSH